MSSPYPIKPSLRDGEEAVAVRGEAHAGARGGSRAALCAFACVGLFLSACSSTPTERSKSDEATAVSSDARGSSGTAGQSSTAARTTPLPDAADGVKSSAALSAAQPEVPKRAAADFERAVNLMRAGNTTDAELEFKQLAAGYPQLAGPQINLGLLQRKAGRLEEAETTLKAATQRNPASAIAWNELGVTLRMRGQFKDAAAAYDHAIAADPNFAPAHRNLAVLLDLYLGDAQRALTELERYKELTGEEKPVTGWIAELRQRTGKPAAPKPAAPPAETAPADAAPAQPADAQPQAAPAASSPKAGEP
jgi:tetratricopeptide (TPR) repeat protein